MEDGTNNECGLGSGLSLFHILLYYILSYFKGSIQCLTSIRTFDSFCCKKCKEQCDPARLSTPATICFSPGNRTTRTRPYFRRGRESATRPCNDDNNKKVVLLRPRRGGELCCAVLRNSELLRGSSFGLKYIPRFGCRFNEMNQTSGILLIPSLPPFLPSILLLLLPSPFCFNGHKLRG